MADESAGKLTTDPYFKEQARERHTIVIWHVLLGLQVQKFNGYSHPRVARAAAFAALRRGKSQPRAETFNPLAARIQ